MDQNTIDCLSCNEPLDRSGQADHCMNCAHGNFDLAESLPESMVSKGKAAIKSGNLQEGLKCFDEALKMDPHNAKMYFDQGLFLFECSEKHHMAKILLAASKKFKMATAIAPQYFEAWQMWASALFTLGVNHQEHHYFQEAQKKALRAIDLSSQQCPDVLADLYWKLGAIGAHLALYSGEALDLHQAINAFFKAHSLFQELPAEFWRDYANACYQFAEQINDTHFHVKAISCIKKALTLSPQGYDCQRLLARIFQSLYFHTHDEEHCAKAEDAYSHAAKLKPNDASLWFDWAKFLCSSSRRVCDVKKLHSCIDKCQRAVSCDPNLNHNADLQSIWTEALALLGNETEKLDILFEAQERIADVIETAEHNPAVWYALGTTLKAFGRYFNDFDYYVQAIEKFQAGLSIDRTRHALWHGIGSIYILLAELGGERQDLERSVRFFQKAIDLHPSTFYIIDYAIALSKLGEMTHEQERLELSAAEFERALRLQRNALYLHPDWLMHYACCLDALGDFYEEDTYYLRAIEIFSHVLMIDPDCHTAHHRIALALSHLGEFSGELEHFYRAIRHLAVAAKHDEENDCIVLDNATILINIAHRSCDASQTDQLYKDAEQELWNAIRLGNPQGYYLLACLYSLMDQCQKAMPCLYRAAHFDILPSIDEMLQDDWLDNLRSTGEFIAFLSHLEQRGNLQEEC